MARERSLNGDARGLEVANFADQNHVRILTQNRTQGQRESQVDFVVDRALDDAVDFVLDGIFGGDDLGVDVVEFGERGVERGGLAGSGRASDEDDAVGLVNDLAEEGEQLGIHADAIEREADVGAVQDADDDAFAEERGENADAHVDGVAADVEFDATVLGHAPLGDVEVRHDLDAARDGGGEMPRRRNHFIEHAVAAVAHLVFVFERFEVNVRGVIANGHQQDHVDELAHGLRVGEFRDVVQIDGRFALEGGVAEVGVGFEHRVDRGDRLFLLAGVGPLDERLDLLERREDRQHVLDAEQVLQVVHRLKVVRVGNGDGERVVLEADRHEFVELGHLLLHELDGFGRRLGVFEVDEPHAVEFGRGLEQLIVVDEVAFPNEVGERSLAGSHVFVDGFELDIVEEAEIDELLAELAGVGIDVGEAVLGRRRLLGCGSRRGLSGGRLGRARGRQLRRATGGRGLRGRRRNFRRTGRGNLGRAAGRGRVHRLDRLTR